RKYRIFLVSNGGRAGARFPYGKAAAGTAVIPPRALAPHLANLLFSPQSTRPWSSTAPAWFPNMRKSTHAPSATPSRWTGAAVSNAGSFTVPRPSPPLPLAPQHEANPLAIAHPLRSPEEMAHAFSSPFTREGYGTSDGPVTPDASRSFLPQP